MTTIYVPRLIESAEQADSLPEGTIARNESAPRGGSWYSYTRTKIRHGAWAGDDIYRSANMVGWTALVPIEAEEEWGVEISEDGEVSHVMPALTLEAAEWKLSFQPPGAARIVRRTRFVTPWEEA